MHLVLVWELRSFSKVSRCWELIAVKWDQVYNKKGDGRDLNYQLQLSSIFSKMKYLSSIVLVAKMFCSCFLSVFCF